ncbi:MAG: inositol monophosphatase [Bacteroidota bacterium]|jgi:myo-inositol-1(or 4)-monophosphatase|nr:inositol monophosphatase [Bacteroidota bacterium]
MKDLDVLVQEVISLAKQAGAFIREAGKKFKPESIEYKGLNDLVSFVDKEAEIILVKGLRSAIPEAGFITEEGTASSNNEDYKWIIDPLDGTTNFIHKLPVFAVSIGLIKGNKIILGVVYEINRDECFYAVEGGKAYCNGEIISVSVTKDLGGCLLATGFPYYNFEKMQLYLKIIDKFMQVTHGLRRMGSAAVDLAYVACGRFEGFFEYNLHPWDVAAGIIIVQQAGGIVTDFKGEDDALFGRQILAANQVHPKMMEVIQSHWV